MTWLDSAIEAVFPGWARRRLLARAHCQYIRHSRAFEAGINDRLAARKKHSTAGPNERSKASLTTTRAQARELYRYNPFARGAVNSIVANLVGCGIKPQARVVSPRLLTPDEGWNDRAERLWSEWARGSDLTGKKSFYEQQSEIERELIVTGEVLAYLRTPLDDRRIPLAIEVLASERLADTDSKLPNGGRIVQGVEFNSEGLEVAYHVWPEHPGDSFTFHNSPVRIPADRIIHLKNELEPDQVRGMTGFLTVAGTCEAMMQWLDFVMTRERVASAFALMITQENPGWNQVHTGDTDDETDDDGNEIANLEGGLIFHGKPGEGLAGIGPSTQAVNVDALFTIFLRQIARGLDVSYELVARDLTKVTYLSARQGERQDRKHWEPQQEKLNRDFNIPIWRWFIDQAFLIGALARPANSPIDRFYEVEFVRPGWDWIDPKKEIEADILAIGAGLKSEIEVITRRGGDWVKILQDRARFRDWAQDLGLTLTNNANGGGSKTPDENEVDEEPTNGTTTSEEEDDEAAA